VKEHVIISTYDNEEIAPGTEPPRNSWMAWM